MLTLTTEQRAAVDLVVGGRARVACITGGPGTGKTTTVRELLTALRMAGRSVALCAPSGKAANRLAEATGAGAQTIHRLLWLRPGCEDPEPLTCDVVVVDEASMVDVPLMAKLCRAAFGPGGRVATIVLVGDADQLPPVGPGSPFHDLLASGTVPAARLTVVQRQALDSPIVRAAYAIQRGEEPEWTTGFELVATPDAGDVPATCHRLFREHGLEPESAQVLAPQRTLSAGVEAINAHLERARETGEALLRGKFRAGTKVIHTKNNYQLGVFNGEIGRVTEVRPGAKPERDEATVEIAGDERVYRGRTLGELAPAWALTVHKSQGSEWKNVLVVCHPQHSFMLSRSLLYVAATRARERVFVVGTAEAVERAVRRVEDLRRKTQLQRWLGKKAA